ncbi:MAG: TRAP transporter small permease subunit [Spirochaetales bacterium]|nr:TRAP transporter small permease subunit [Spirochaetales bacterium]
MSTVKKILKGLTYFLGTIVPNVTFTVIFVTFMVTIISRYILKTPVAWSYEISILAYMWTMFFGVGKAMARDEHVVFGLVYDAVKPRTRLIFKISSNLILIILIAVAFVPSINSLLSKRMVTGVLKLPFRVVFAPLIYMFAEIIIRSLIDLKTNVLDLKNLGTAGKEGN